ncbi:MAG: hypothetical protein J7M16_13580 [Anaerolineae bacterium]|nr:hypothetical protein [Anaerolineae bacterium]
MAIRTDVHNLDFFLPRFVLVQPLWWRVPAGIGKIPLVVVVIEIILNIQVIGNPLPIPAQPCGIERIVYVHIGDCNQLRVILLEGDRISRMRCQRGG